jgi:hypothetical protein
MSFTPGPWVYESYAQCDPTGEYYHGIAIDGEGGASSILTMDGDYDNAEDDARLIAAAPELLAACELCQALDAWIRADARDEGQFHETLRKHGWNGDEMTSGFVRRFRKAAIAKATGVTT